MELHKRADMYRGQLQDIKNSIIDRINKTILMITEGNTEEQVELKRPIIITENDSDDNLNETISAVDSTTVYIGNVFEPIESTFDKFGMDILITLLDDLEDQINYK